MDGPMVNRLRMPPMVGRLGIGSEETHAIIFHALHPCWFAKPSNGIILRTTWCNFYLFT